METTQQKPKYSIFFPILILAVGVFLLLNNLSENPFHTGTMLLALWPLLFVAGGLDSIYKREGLAGPLLFIALGMIFLMSNLGYSHLSNWQYLLRYWPVIIIAFGLDILFPLRNLYVSIFGLLLAAAVIIGIAYLVTNNTSFQNAPSETNHISVLADDVNKASIDLQMNAGSMQIGTQAEPEYMVEGTLQLFENSKVYQEESIQNNTGFYSLKSSGFQFFEIKDQNMDFEDNRWDIQLNKNIPTTLDSVLIAGQMTSEISDMQTLDMENTVIFGQSIIILPEYGDVNIYSSVIFGELIVNVPQGANAMILIDTALDTVDVPAGFTKNGSRIYSPDYDPKKDPVTIKVSVPIGSIDIVSQP